MTKNNPKLNIALLFLGAGISIYLFYSSIPTLPSYRIEALRRIRVIDFNSQFKDLARNVQNGTIHYSRILAELQKLSSLYPELQDQIKLLFDSSSSRRKLLRNAEDFIKAYDLWFDSETQKTDFTTKLMLAEEIHYILNHQNSNLPADIKSAIAQALAQGTAFIDAPNSPMVTYLLGKYYRSPKDIQYFLNRIASISNNTQKDALSLIALTSADTFSRKSFDLLFQISEDAFNKNNATATRIFQNIYYLSNIPGLNRILKEIAYNQEDVLRGFLAHLEEAMKLEKVGYKMADASGRLTNRNVEIAFLSYYLNSGEIDALLVLDSLAGSKEEMGLSWVEVTHYSASLQPGEKVFDKIKKDENSSAVYTDKIIRHFANFALLKDSIIDVGEGNRINFHNMSLIGKNGEIKKLSFDDRMIFDFSFKAKQFNTVAGSENVDYSADDVKELISEARAFLLGIKGNIITWTQTQDPQLAWVGRKMETISRNSGIDLGDLKAAVLGHQDFLPVVVPANLSPQLVQYLLSLPKP